ncbi:MAG: type II secretion system protein GspC [Gammaproteobacteria bacterium]|nr:type II secretion system protein GspC [Gammaproteobacteria bacterium]
MNTIDLKQFSSLNINGVVQAFNTYMPTVASTALVVVLAQSMANLTWDVMPELPYVAPPDTVAAITSSRSTQSASSSAASYNKITSFHLFGIAGNDVVKPIAVPVPAAQDAPDTQLRLILKGVVASADMMDAWAIVADKMGNEDSYGIEAPLPGGAILKEIYSDRIILLHNGRMETLRLPKDELGSNNSARSISGGNGRSTRNRGGARSASRASNNVSRLSSQAAQTLRTYKDKLLNDPQSVMNSVRAEPYRESGRLKGYRIFPGQDKDLFGQMGLEPGDIVTSVNGIELDSPLKGLEIMQQLSDTANVSVNVLRNGVSQTFESSLN